MASSRRGEREEAGATPAPRQALAAGAARPFGPIRTRRIFEEICDSVRDKLILGEFKPGDRLPSERDLSEMFAVSRTAVREALRSLEIAGIVDLRKGSKGGAFITGNGVDRVTRTFRDMLDFGRVSLAALLEARLLVMDVVVRTACDRATAEDIAALRTNVADTIALTKAGLYEERTLKAVEFSTVLANSTGNAVMSAILEAMASVIRVFIVVAGPPPHDPVVKSRLRLIEQIEARDADGASQTMRTYLVSLNEHLLAAERTGRAAEPKRGTRRRVTAGA